ncbi:PREDICTED: uncharacterized protein LOC109220422 [Nicotiana attenuata]|uniref:uncharacterized protein LOC109220422 n=1 Tax=Nicotiana attenuata TaxID=49451 RepID=UPI0009054939|nr:PREDICTED: uncharacterized protein LOC109220422 [Nicotiana attenuata]
MYEFGEELIIENYKVPWLIWIQLVVMILLVLLLFFGFSILDLPNNSNSSASSSSSTSQGPTGSSPNCNSTATLQNRNQNENIKRGTEASTSREIARADESQERVGSAEKEDATIFKLFVRPQHPCNYFGLAKQAFLKCLGFDSDRDNCNTRRHAKED